MTNSFTPQYDGTYGTLYYVKDMAKAVSYYKELLGLNLKFESPEWSEFDFNGHSFCLHLQNDPTQVLDGKATLIAKVKGLRSWVDAMKIRGVEFANDVHQVCEGGYAADVVDPQGNRVSFFERIEN